MTWVSNQSQQKESDMASSVTWLLFSNLLRLITKKTSWLHITGSLWEKSKDDWWILVTKGQWSGKRLRILTFSYTQLVGLSARKRICSQVKEQSNLSVRNIKRLPRYCDSASATNICINCLYDIFMSLIVAVVKIMKLFTISIFCMKSLSVINCNLEVTGIDWWSMNKVLEWTCHFIPHILRGVIIYPILCAKLTLIQPAWCAYTHHLVIIIWYMYSLVSPILQYCPNIWTSRPLPWVRRFHGLLWTLHYPKYRHCDVTIIKPLLTYLTQCSLVDVTVDTSSWAAFKILSVHSNPVVTILNFFSQRFWILGISKFYMFAVGVISKPHLSRSLARVAGSVIRSLPLTFFFL